MRLTQEEGQGVGATQTWSLVGKRGTLDPNVRGEPSIEYTKASVVTYNCNSLSHDKLVTI